MALYDCARCGKAFVSFPSHRTGAHAYCSQRCANAGRPKRRVPNIPCDHCGKMFYRPPSQVGAQKYCSQTCGARSRPAPTREFNCETCGTPVVRKASRRGAYRFCSLQCRRVRTEDRILVGEYWHVRVGLEDAKTHHARPHRKRATRPWIAEHIVLAERALGRPLRKGEVVHHINCDKRDNSRGNLMVCTRAYHAWLHGEMSRRWAQDNIGRAA